jgi:hypothetical protein
MIFTWFLGLPWYVDLGASLAVLVVGWFLVGLVTKLTVKRPTHTEVRNGTHDDGTPRWKKVPIREDAVETQYQDALTTHRITWGCILVCLTILGWYAAPVVLLTIGAIWGIVVVAKGMTKLGDKAGGISQARKEASAKKAELVRQAEETNDAWLAQRLADLDSEWEQVKAGNG